MTREVVSGNSVGPQSPGEAGTGVAVAAPNANAGGKRPYEVTGTLAKGAGISLGGNMLGRLAYLAIQVILARALGPEMFGLYSVGWSFIMLGGTLLPLGLDKGIVKFAAPYWPSNPKLLRYTITRGLLISSVIAVISSILMFILAPWLAQTVFGEPALTMPLRYFAPGLGLVALMNVSAAITTISLRMQYNVYSLVVGQPLSNLLMTVAVFALGYRLNGAVTATVLSFGFATAVAIFYVVKLLRMATSMAATQPETAAVSEPGSRRFFRDLMAFSLPTSLAGVFVSFGARVDRLVIAALLPESFVGIYQSASQFSIAFIIALIGFSSIIGAMVPKLHAEGNIREIENIFRTTTKWGFYLTLPLFLFLVILPHETMVTIFGLAYESATIPLVILSVGQFVNGLTGAVWLILMMSGYQKTWFWTSLVAFIISIGACVFLTPRFGLVGSALATSASVAVLNLWGLLNVRYKLHIWPYDRRFIKGLVAGAAALAVPLVVKLIGIKFNALVLGGTFGAMYLVFLITLFIQKLDSEDQAILKAISSLLMNRRPRAAGDSS